MTQKKAEILLAAVIAARATSLLFSKIAMNGMGIFNLLAARFLMAFVLLAVVFFKRLRHIKRHTLVRGATMGALFFLMLSTELTGLKSTPSSTVSLLENTAIILVPMAEAVLRHKLPKAVTAVSALVAIGGVALLTGQSGGFTPRYGAGGHGRRAVRRSHHHHRPLLPRGRSPDPGHRSGGYAGPAGAGVLLRVRGAPPAQSGTSG